MNEKCGICGCKLRRGGDYAKPTVRGRLHATRHHHIAERFFGRSSNRRGTKRAAIFSKCPWNAEGTTSVFCYECHEELITPSFCRMTSIGSRNSPRPVASLRIRRRRIVAFLPVAFSCYTRLSKPDSSGWRNKAMSGGAANAPSEEGWRWGSGET